MVVIGKKKVANIGDYSIFCECRFHNNFGYGSRSYTDVIFIVELDETVVEKFADFETAVKHIDILNFQKSK